MSETMNIAHGFDTSKKLQHASYSLQIETAQRDEQGNLRIKGLANTFGVMRSRRVLLPSAFNDWLAGNNGNVNINLLANHGFVPGFASIGKVETMRVTNKGLQFEGFIGKGTVLMDEAATLVESKILDSFSLGWMSNQSRVVSREDSDLDPHLKKLFSQNKELTHLWAFFRVEVVELSLVDVADDRGAKLAADFRRGLLDDVRSALRDSQPATKTGTPVPDSAAVQDAIATIVREQIARMDDRLSEFKDEVVGAVEGVLADHGDYAGYMLLSDEDSPRSCTHADDRQPNAGNRDRIDVKGLRADLAPLIQGAKDG